MGRPRDYSLHYGAADLIIPASITALLEYRAPKRQADTAAWPTDCRRVPGDVASSQQVTVYARLCNPIEACILRTRDARWNNRDAHDL